MTTLSGATSGAAYFDVYSGAKIDLSSAAITSGGSLEFTAKSGGTTLLKPSVTSLSNTRLTLDSGNFPIGQLTTFGGTIEVDSGTATFPSLTSINADNVYAYGGAAISFPNVTSYAGSNSSTTVQASGVGPGPTSTPSLIDLSHVTTLSGATSGTAYFDVYSGAKIDLSSAAGNAAGQIEITSNGAASLIDLSSLLAIGYANGGYSIHTTNGGNVIDPNLTTFFNGTITNDPTATLNVPANKIFSFSGGTNTITTGTVNDQGSMNVSNSPLIIKGGLTIIGQGGLSLTSAGSLQISGNVTGNTTNAAGFSPLGNVVLNSGNGANNPPQILEVMSQDLGNVAAGFNQNFAYSTLQLTANTSVELVDLAHNSSGSTPEALYVNNLIVPAGATLNLDGLNLYVHTETINGTIISGGAVVSGQVFKDINGNGVLDGGESGLAAASVTLTNTATNSVYSTTTNSSGLFTFGGVAAGSYTLAENVPAGYAQTQPTSPGTYAITVVSGQTVTGKNFADHPTASIGGTVFNDLNGDGTLQTGESGLSGWTVKLLDNSNTVIATTTTSASGGYSFNNLLPGTYTAQAVSQSGYVATSSASLVVTDTNGAADTVNFGEFAPVTISGKVTSLTTNLGLSGWTVDLIQGSQTVPATTGADGSFSFSNVGPGTYTVSVVQQSGYFASTGPFTETTTSGTNITGLGLSEFQTVTVSGTVFQDDNQNGSLDGKESGIAGWTINLLNSSSQIVSSATTDVNGGYSFSLQNAGTYTVQEVLQAKYTQTAPASGAYTINAVSGSQFPNQNFGDYKVTYPDLVTSSVSAVATASVGQQVAVNWTLTNNGTVVATGPWTEQVLLATDAAGDNPTLLTTQTYSGSLPGGQSVGRSANVLIPNLTAGNYWLVVSENPFNEIAEQTSTNNLAASALSINGTLTLALSTKTVSDAAGPNATTAMLTRNTDTTNALLATISNSDPNDVVTPQTVTIPAGATSVAFPVGVINNHIVEGTQTATLTASATGEVSGSTTLTVTDTNVPTLALVLNSHSVHETDTNPATFGTITRNTSTNSALTVSLLSNTTNKLTVPASVTIPAGQASVTFPVTVVNDAKIDGNQAATITVAAGGYQTASDNAVVIDDNVPTLGLVLANQTVSESAGATATTGTVSIASPAVHPITIVLTSSDTTAATVPKTVVIAAGQSSASFSVSALNDGLATGDKTTAITASIETNAGVVLSQSSINTSLLLKESDGPALSVSFSGSGVKKGASATATVTRNTTTTNPVVVTLSSSDPTKATVPGTVTIPSGQSSVSFAVSALDDHTPDGLQNVQIVAMAAGLDNGIGTLGITDVDLPDLVVSTVTAPVSTYDNTLLDVSWTVSNSGQYPAAGSWTDSIYLDPIGGPQSTKPVDTVRFTGVVNPGLGYTQSDNTIPSPSTVGQYLVRVVTDGGQSVQELNFSNNSGTAAQPLNDQAAYSATVNSNATTVTNGTPIVLSGVATMAVGNAAAAEVPVAVQIQVGGTTRTLTATTDANGAYSTTFLPLPNEAGEYSVAASDPGVTNPAVQAHFQIIGFASTPTRDNVTVIPNTPLTGHFTLTNLGDTVLTGLTATVYGGLPGLTVQLTPPSQLPASGSATLGYSLLDTSTTAVSTVVTIHVTTDQGATLDILLGISVRPLTPMLSVNPGYLNSGMVVGNQSSISFTVVNHGGAASGDLKVALPTTSYMTLISPATIPSLDPGASATVTLQLSPPANLTLGQYVGSIGIGGTQTGINVPFTFTAITTAMGSVHVLVDDDYTFQVAGEPHVQGATVTLLNPYDNSQVVATGVTDATGAITFNNIPAGPYDLKIQADKHASYKSSYTVVAGITNIDEVFLQRQFVTYTWDVVPTTIQDQYQIKLNTTFETNVPVPVVTLSAPSSLPVMHKGQTWTFNATVTNHGLIAAQGVTLTMPTDPEYTFTALSDDIGTVPANSSVQVPITVTATKEPTPTGGACTLAITGDWYYVYGDNHITSQLVALMSVPGRYCTAEDVQGALIGGSGSGGSVLPSVFGAINCNPDLNNILQQLLQASNNSSNSLINTASAVVGTDQAATSAGTSGNVSPSAFIATALGNLGLISGQVGNAGLSPALLAQMSSTIASFDQTEADLTGIFATLSDNGSALGIEGDVALLQQVYARLKAVTDAENLLFGGDANWLNTDQTATLQQWITGFFSDIQNASDGGSTITVAERAQLLATTLPSSVTLTEASVFLDRWNRTAQYWSQGIYSAAQVPSGQNTDFLDVRTIQAAFDAAETAEKQSQVNGFTDPGAEFQAAVTQVQNDFATQGVCASIKMQIDQTATLAREAFAGTLTITNSEEAGSLSNVTMDIHITDVAGNPANGQFFISSPTYSSQFSVVNGNAILPDNATGTIKFTFIPDETAAPTTPIQYRIGGTIGFTDPTSGPITEPVFPSTITVYPQAKLQLNYFLQTDVIGDDPFTPQVEPSEAATLGLLVTNVGGGTAKQLSITTAQPQIVQNEKGLLDTFQIVGTQVGSQPQSPSLTVNLGDVAPGQTADANFSILSSLQGIFNNFTATFSHSDALGGLDTSLISSVQTHPLVHAGNFNFPGSTGATDYLANDIPDPAGLPDTIYFSDGTTAQVNIAQATSTQAGLTGQLSYQVTANVTSGWNAIQVPDPGAGYTLYKVVRSDGTLIRVGDQAWTTDRTISPVGRGTVDNELHILDLNSTGSYRVYYKPTTVGSPSVASISTISSPQSGPVNSVDVTFSEPIDPTTFMTSSLSLTLNGGPNVINSSVTITQDSPTTFTIGGLSTLTTTNGNYALTVNAASVKDFFNDTGTGSGSMSWTTGSGVPTIVSVGAANPALRNTAVTTVDVVLSEAIDSTTFSSNALSLTRNGGLNLITSAVTVSQINPTTYRIGGLPGLTAIDGTYVLTVTATGLKDAANHSGAGLLSTTWVLDSVAPTVVSFPTYIQTPRNIIVPVLDVVFSKPIDPTTFTYQDLNYSKTGGPNLITSDVTITQLSATEFRIANFNSHLNYPIDGNYTFTVNATGVMDLAGNTGSGSLSTSWYLDTTAPAEPTNLIITPETGVNGVVQISNTGKITLTGTVSEAGLTIDVLEKASLVNYGEVTASGTSFQDPLTNLSTGLHTLLVTATDPSGNVSDSTTLMVMIDVAPPAVTSVTQVSTPRNTSVSSVDVTFSKPIDPTTFTLGNLRLSDNGGTNLITSAVTISPVAGQAATYRISGLGNLTTAEGSYVLTASATGVADLSGNTGTSASSVSSTWLMDTTAPTSTIQPLAATTTSSSILVSVISSDPNGIGGSAPSGVASFTIYVSTNGGPYVDWMTLPALTHSIVYPAQNGNTYSFYSVATDNAGNIQSVPPSAQAVTKVNTLSLSPGPDQSVTEGQTLSLAGASYTSSESISGLTLMINWGDGKTESGVLAQGMGGGTLTNTHQYADAGKYTIMLSLSDTSGVSVARNLFVSVEDVPLTITKITPPVPVEGISTGSVTLATFSDANPIANINDFTATVSWGDGHTSTATAANGGIKSNLDGTFSIVANNTYGETASGLTFSVTISDIGGSTKSSSITVNVSDAPLTNVTPTTTISGTEGQANTNVVLMAFSDGNPSATASDFSVSSINWSGTLAGTLPTLSIVADPTYVGSGSGWKVLADTVTYVEKGSNAVSLTVSDTDGSNVHSSKTTFNVADAPLVDTTLPKTISSVFGSNTGTVVLATFTDGNPLAPLSDFTASVDWAPGVNTIGTLTGTPTVSVQLVSRSATSSTWQVVGSATYAKIGSYSPVVTLNDIDGAVLQTAKTTFNITGYQTQLVSYSIQNGQTQRSFIRYFDVYFSDTAGLSRFLNGQGIQLIRYDINGLNPTIVPLAGLVKLNGTHMTIDFGANGIGGNRLTNVGDGTYVLSFDLAGTGVLGSPIQFTRLLGDVTGDGSVDANDITAYQSDLKNGDINGDINGDSLINSADLLLIRNAQGRKIKKPV